MSLWATLSRINQCSTANLSRSCNRLPHDTYHDVCEKIRIAHDCGVDEARIDHGDDDLLFG